ncbi:MAG: ATP-dependent sacrificial sulfur transferase LarE [Clostridiales bacterium]|nr:ATP-dependent sacrificial sulfur transferase LarE [Clostridiales bacterium]
MKLTQFFREHPKAALAYSGGVDSSYLFYEAVKSGADICAYYCKTELQPEFELRDAVRLSNDIGGRLKILHLSVLEFSDICENSPLRCYYCKQYIFGLIMKQALADGYDLLLDGNNASDSITDRPGMKASGEMGVLSPLRESGLTKKDIRALSRDAGLFTWNKPAYSCLATRIPTGKTISGELLEKIERGEQALFALGFSDFRLRAKDGYALLQLPESQLETAANLWDTIENKLAADFPSVRLDRNPRASD